MAEQPAPRTADHDGGALQEIGCEHDFGVVYQCPTCGTPRHCSTDEWVTSRAFKEKYGEPNFNEGNREAERWTDGYTEGHAAGRAEAAAGQPPPDEAVRLLVELVALHDAAQVGQDHHYDIDGLYDRTRSFLKESEAVSPPPTAASDQEAEA